MRKWVLLSIASLVMVVTNTTTASPDEQRLGTPPGKTMTVTKTVDVRFVEASALDVLRFLAQAADIDILLSPPLLQGPAARITIDAHAANVANVFAQVCKLAGLRFTVLDANTVMVAWE